MDNEDVKIVNTVCSRNCYSACGMQAFVKDGKVVKIKGNPNNPATYGLVCAKGLSYPKLLDCEERLRYPLKRTGERGDGRFERIGWDEAIDEIYHCFTALSEKFGPETLLYYAASGNHGSAMQAYAMGFWYQLGGFSATRGSLCSPAGNTGVHYTYGICKDSAIADIENAKLIILWGKNPSSTNMHTMPYIHKAVKNGAKLVTIDPRRNESSNESHLHLFPRCGTDGLLAIGIAKYLVEKGLADNEFINRYTYGYDRYLELLSCYSWEEIIKLTEIGEDEWTKLFALIEATPRFLLILGKGFQRCSNGGQSSRAISLLPALTGGIGKSGSGLFYSDAQRPKYEWPYYPPIPQKIRRDINIGRIASEIPDRDDPPIKAMWIERANPVTSNPNQNKLLSALKNLDYIVCVEQFMTDTAVMADIVLPAAMFLEENDLVFSYGHSYIQLKQKAAQSPAECKSDKQIYHMLGQRFGLDMRYLPEDDDEILENVICASGFETTLEKLKSTPYLYPEYQDIAFADMRFLTPSGKIEFFSQSLQQDWGVNPLPVYEEPEESRYSSPELFEKYPLQFMSAHAKEKINSQLFTERFKENKPAVQMHISDALPRDISNGDMVRIFNDRGEIFAEAEVGTMIKPGVVNVFEGWWNFSKASVNVLSEDRDTDIGYGAAYHNCLVEAQKAASYERD